MVGVRKHIARTQLIEQLDKGDGWVDRVEHQGHVGSSACLNSFAECIAAGAFALQEDIQPKLHADNGVGRGHDRVCSQSGVEGAGVMKFGPDDPLHEIAGRNDIQPGQNLGALRGNHVIAKNPERRPSRCPGVDARRHTVVRALIVGSTRNWGDAMEVVPMKVDESRSHETAFNINDLSGSASVDVRGDIYDDPITKLRI